MGKPDRTSVAHRGFGRDRPPPATLADLARRQTGIVSRIDGTDPLFRQRLQALGIVRGTEVRADHTAPLGDPRVYTVRGYRLTLRNAEARQVLLASP